MARGSNATQAYMRLGRIQSHPGDTWVGWVGRADGTRQTLGSMETGTHVVNNGWKNDS